MYLNFFKNMILVSDDSLSSVKASSNMRNPDSWGINPRVLEPTWVPAILSGFVHKYYVSYKFIWRSSWTLGHFFTQQCTFYFLFLSFWLHHGACGVLVTWSGIDPHPQQLKLRVLTIGPPGNSLLVTFKATIFLKEWEESKSIIWSYSLFWVYSEGGGVCIHMPCGKSGGSYGLKQLKRGFYAWISWEQLLWELCSIGHASQS